MIDPIAATPRRPLWPWAILILAIAWSSLVRVPLVLNAADHLDSDLAVDGLTLFEALDGHWRWHYPGTPHIGTPPVLLSWVQAKVWGASPITLVSGGTVAWGLVVTASFLACWRGFGPNAAAWSLVPLAFGSTGVVWLSGRITGGHLLVTAWHAVAIAGLGATMARPSVLRAAALGLWCGLGLYVDSMFVVTLASIGLACSWAWAANGFGRDGLVALGSFLPALALGFTPYLAGQHFEPHDAYAEQFAPIYKPSVLAAHAKILLLDCLPRLVAGHRLPGFQAEPAPTALPGRPPIRGASEIGPVAVIATVTGLGLFAASVISLLIVREASDARAARAVRRTLALASVGVAAGFVLNRNIFNSDNYRYLVFLIPAASSGFGLLAARLSSRGPCGLAVASVLAAGLSLIMTLDTAEYYRRLGWIDEGSRPVRTAIDDPTLAWLIEHPEVTHLFAGYWDAYRLAFLVGGRLEGVPFPVFPNRFPERRPWPADGAPRWTMVRPAAESQFFAAEALKQGARPVFRTRGVTILEAP
ncbi:hypothetical protein EP7_003382 [Isosphaeraceae bacterium EP7]